MTVVMHNGLVKCPRCVNTDKRYTPIGLARHWSEAHPVKLTIRVPAQPLETVCPLGDGLSCKGCFFAVPESTRCRFGEFKNRIGDY